MVDTDSLKEVVPHYVAMLLIIFVVINAIRITVGDLGFWIELVIVLIIATAYQPAVLRLGIAPKAWEKRWESE